MHNLKVTQSFVTGRSSIWAVSGSAGDLWISLPINQEVKIKHNRAVSRRNRVFFFFLSYFLCLLLVSHLGILPIYHARHADCVARSALGAFRWFHHWGWSGDSAKHKSIHVKSHITLNHRDLQSLAYDTLCASKVLYTYHYHFCFVLTWYKVSSRVKVTKFSVKQICQELRQ